MRLVAANLPSREFGDFSAAPSVRSLVPKIAIDRAATSERTGRVRVAIPKTGKNGQAGDARNFALPAERSRWRSAGRTDEAGLN
jgi:hypothetical protein